MKTLSFMHKDGKRFYVAGNGSTWATQKEYAKKYTEEAALRSVDMIEKHCLQIVVGTAVIEDIRG